MDQVVVVRGIALDVHRRLHGRHRRIFLIVDVLRLVFLDPCVRTQDNENDTIILQKTAPI